MYRAVVIDDEEVIVTGLVRTMPWAKYGCEVVATASDGIRALDTLRRVRPDILFTDIQMPGADGLAVIAAVRSEFPEMQVTILSGYPNFEYAQRAIALGVVRYVLKPSHFADLEEALARMVDRLDALRGRPAAQPLVSPGQSGPETPGAPAQKEQAQAAENRSVFAQKQGQASENLSAPAQEAQTQGGENRERPAQEAQTQGTEAAASLPAAESAHNFIVHNAKAYIRAHYAEKMTLEEVADHVYVSQWHLSKLISRYTDQSFSDLLNGVRIEKAQELLADPALRIWEVSEAVGFADVTHFSRIFKKRTGMSANEFRARRLCEKDAASAGAPET